MSPSEPEETYLTVAEVAETLKLNQQTVRNWIDQGSLPALRVGRRVRIKRSDFERILAESYSAGSVPAGRPGAWPSRHRVRRTRAREVRAKEGDELRGRSRPTAGSDHARGATRQRRLGCGNARPQARA